MKELLHARTLREHLANIRMTLGQQVADDFRELIEKSEQVVSTSYDEQEEALQELEEFVL